MVKSYKLLKTDVFRKGIYSLVPIRMEDRYDIMKWRNEQIYHLRQTKPLTSKDQDAYFETVVSNLFDQDQPDQIIFSYLEKDRCIGYGGLVHINWIDRHAEISFIINTDLEPEYFEFHWETYLNLIETVAFEEIGLHKIFTYAYDMRPRLYPLLEKIGFIKDAVLRDHYFLKEKEIYLDVVIHSKTRYYIKEATEEDINLTYNWANDPLIRKHSINRTFIPFENHKEWFLNKINSDKCCYLIFFNYQFPIGSIRFDLEKGPAIINYLIDPSFHGKGYGKNLLRIGINYMKKKNINEFCGLVLYDNAASIKIFEALEFIADYSDNSKIRFYLKLN